MHYVTNLALPTFKRADGGVMPNTGGWQDQHKRALQAPKGPEGPIVGLLTQWANYADSHQARYGSGIGEDSILGGQWAAIGVGIRGLLNGETGRLDCGTLDSFILDTLTAEKFTEDGEYV